MADIVWKGCVFFTTKKMKKIKRAKNNNRSYHIVLVFNFNVIRIKRETNLHRFRNGFYILSIYHFYCLKRAREKRINPSSTLFCHKLFKRMIQLRLWGKEYLNRGICYPPFLRFKYDVWNSLLRWINEVLLFLWWNFLKSNWKPPELYLFSGPYWLTILLIE